MNIQDALTIRSILREKLGAQWPAVLLRALKMSGVLFRKTHWGGSRTAEATYVRRAALPAALYFQIQALPHMGREGALRTIERLMFSLGPRDQWSLLKSLATPAKSGMPRLMAFHAAMDVKGAPQFNTRIYKEKTENRCHYVITRCVFNEFFVEVGAPELTRFFCAVDRRFFSDAFPDFTFHRGDSWENTIAYGKPQCDFIFDKKTVEAG